MPAGNAFAGRRICLHSATSVSRDFAYNQHGSPFYTHYAPSNLPAHKKLGDCCRRLLVTHGVDVRVSLCIRQIHLYGNECADLVKCLAPHLSKISQSSCQIGLQELLPAAAQLEQVRFIALNSDNISLLEHFQMLKELHMFVHWAVQLTLPLPRLHTLYLRVWQGTVLREDHLKCLFSQAPALRQLVLDCEEDRPLMPVGYHQGLPEWQVEALMGLQCQQLDLLTLVTSHIDEHSVKMLAQFPCPLKLSIAIPAWSLLGSAPLFTMLARLPHLVALKLILLQQASNALWDERGAFLPHVQKLELSHLPLHMNNLHLPLQSILSMCPALKHLSLHSWPKLQVAAKPEVHARLWHAFKSCAKLASLTCD